MGRETLADVRRRLIQGTDDGDAHVTVSDLKRFAASFADLADADVMEQAWDRSTDS